MNQSSDLWLQEFMYIFIFMWSLPPPDWVCGCLSSSTSTANALFNALLARSITLHYYRSQSPPRETQVRQQPTVSQAWEFPCHQLVKGSRKCHPKYVTLAKGLFGAEGKREETEKRKALCPLPTFLKAGHRFIKYPHSLFTRKDQTSYQCRDSLRGIYLTRLTH